MEMQLNTKRLKIYRNSRAWSQSQLAEVSGLSLRTIQRIEKTGVASQESVKSLAAVYECTITELITKKTPLKMKNKFHFNKISLKAKIIHLSILLPAFSIALYLFLMDHDSIAWVNILRDLIFSSSISEQRLGKISFLILVLVVGLPALIPGFVYDFINKQGIFEKSYD